MDKLPKKIVIVAGEASGDLHASHLIKALKKCVSPLSIYGMGGPAMSAAGADVVIDANQVTVVGITEVLSKAPSVLKAMSELKRLLRTTRPDLLILIDFPDFNLHLAGAAKRMAIPVLYYISPQIWAWRSNRVKKIKKRVDHMAVILPFEKQFYEHHDVPVSFVGHPLMDAMTDVAIRQDGTPAEGEPPTVALVPGSRDREVGSLLPVMIETGKLLRQKRGNVRFIVSCAPSIKREMVHSIIDRHHLTDVDISQEPVRELFPRCDLAVVASGTVTLEAAICGTPMVITYAVSPMSYWLGRLLIDVAHIGLVNLIAEARIVPELVQKDANPAAVCEAIEAILYDPVSYVKIRKQLYEVRRRLGEPGASEKVAHIAKELIGTCHAP